MRRPRLRGLRWLDRLPAPGDYDGVGHTEPAVFRPSTDQWYVDKNGVGRVAAVFGGPGDVPVPGDYDGVGHAEVAIFRPSTAQWYVAGLAGNNQVNTFGATNLFDVPTESAAYALKTLGYFNGGGGFAIHASSIESGHGSLIPLGGSSPTTTAAAASLVASQPTPTQVKATGGLVLVPGRTVVPSAILTKDKTWSLAIDQLFG